MAYSATAKRLACVARDKMDGLIAAIDSRFGEKITDATLTAQTTAVKTAVTNLETELALP